MNFHHLISSAPHRSRNCRNPSPTWQRIHHQDINFLKSSGLFGRSPSYRQLECQKQSHIGKFPKAETKKFVINNLRKRGVKISRKNGSIGGAVALIIGTSIGTGLLALPMKTSPAGLVPSSITLTICWAFLLIEALLLVEINVVLQRRKKAKKDSDELEVMSIRTMAQETLGEWGGALATVIYIFLGYTSVVAYCSKSGGRRATDRVNQWLTASMIGLLVAIEAVAVLFGGWSGFEAGGGDWGKVPATVPVMIFALVYHDIAPVVCAYLEGDLTRIRASIIVGSVVPLLSLIVWDAIALGLSNGVGTDQMSDPVELLLRVRWDGVAVMVEGFALLAVGTSLIGTLLGFSEFFKEQINNLRLDHFPPTQRLEKSSSLFYGKNGWWEKNKTSVAATAMVVAPSLFVSTAVPDAFSAATDFAGGYCMTMLYGVLPPAMAWAMKKKKKKGGSSEMEQGWISGSGVAIFGVGLFAIGIVAQQILQDFSSLHP